MKTTNRVKISTSYFLVFLSGAAALIYEVVWQRYLSILLGAQAKATAIVLAVFLGGMSVGYFYYGQLSKRKNLSVFRIFCFIEIGLAAWATLFPFLFHFLFRNMAYLYGGSQGTNLFIDILVSIGLMGLPTVLMGASIPLLTQGLSQNLSSSSRLHSRLYGFNTLGAAVGAFLAGFVLIPENSFRLALSFGVMLNLVVAVISYFLFSRSEESTTLKEATLAKPIPLSLRQCLLLSVGFLSGAYVITFETSVIRLLSLATGSSNYIFSLVVSIFIFSLAIGGLLSKKIKNYSEIRLFWNQVLLAVALGVLYSTVYYWPYWVHLLRIQLHDYGTSFYFYQGSLALLFLILLFVPTLLCGMVLPLCFHLIKDSKESLGYRVGQLYSLNTIGCISGAILGGYYLFHFLNLDQVWRGVIIVTILSALLSYGVYLISYKPSKIKFSTHFLGMLLPVVALSLLKPIDHKIFLQPFRSQEATEESFQGAEEFYKKLAKNTKIIEWKDGPNTTVGIGASPSEGAEASRSIFVNGKSDGNTKGDYFTTVMLGAIPALLNPHPERVCVIGFGTGITIGTLSIFKEVEKIDVVEISGTVLEKAPLFDAYNGNASKSQKVTLHEMDAFRFLEGTQKYNLIVSEPSNPWVTGIENLYSREFYQMAKNALNEEGNLVQWIHTYSFNDELLQMVLRTMSTSFPFVSVFQLKGGDLALVAGNQAMSFKNLLHARDRMQETPVAMILNSAGINNLASFAAMEIMPPALTRDVVREADIHTLESPRLSQRASKAFFMGTQANTVPMKRSVPSLLSGSLLTLLWNETKTKKEDLPHLFNTYCIGPASKNSRICEEVQIASEMLGISGALTTKMEYQKVETRELAAVKPAQIRNKIKTLPDLMKEYTLFDSYRKYISSVTYVPPVEFLSPLEHCLNQVKKNTELWGECLLQKLIVMDTLKVDAMEFKRSGSLFLDWSKDISKDHRIYEKVQQARKIIVNLIVK